MRIIILIAALFLGLVLTQEVLGQPSPADPNSEASQGNQIPVTGSTDPTPYYPPSNSSGQQPCKDCESEGTRLTRLDVNAQQRMAGSTQDMAAYALWGVILTALGLFMLWRTLRYTKDAAETTRETLKEVRTNAKAELRAYLSMGLVTYTKTQWIGDETAIKTEVVWKNMGVTPAYAIEVALQYQIDKEMNGAIPKFVDPEIWEVKGDRGKEQPVEHLSYILVDPEDIELLKQYDAAILFIRCVVRYRDVFNRTITQSICGPAFVWDLLHDDFGKEHIARFDIGGAQNWERITEPESPPRE